MQRIAPIVRERLMDPPGARPLRDRQVPQEAEGQGTELTAGEVQAVLGAEARADLLPLAMVDEAH